MQSIALETALSAVDWDAHEDQAANLVHLCREAYLQPMCVL